LGGEIGVRRHNSDIEDIEKRRGQDTYVGVVLNRAEQKRDESTVAVIHATEEEDDP
jgi:hypothetical protein